MAIWYMVHNQFYLLTIAIDFAVLYHVAGFQVIFIDDKSLHRWLCLCFCPCVYLGCLYRLILVVCCQFYFEFPDRVKFVNGYLNLWYGRLWKTLLSLPSFTEVCHRRNDTFVILTKELCDIYQSVIFGT